MMIRNAFGTMYEVDLLSREEVEKRIAELKTSNGWLNSIAREILENHCQGWYSDIDFDLSNGEVNINRRTAGSGSIEQHFVMLASFDQNYEKNDVDLVMGNGQYEFTPGITEDMDWEERQEIFQASSEYEALCLEMIVQDLQVRMELAEPMIQQKLDGIYE